MHQPKDAENLRCGASWSAWTIKGDGVSGRQVMIVLVRIRFAVPLLRQPDIVCSEAACPFEGRQLVVVPTPAAATSPAGCRCCPSGIHRSQSRSRETSASALTRAAAAVTGVGSGGDGAAFKAAATMRFAGGCSSSSAEVCPPNPGSFTSAARARP